MVFLLFGCLGLGFVLSPGSCRIFSVTPFNSFKVTCASRHTQRLHPCKKTPSPSSTDGDKDRPVSVSSREEEGASSPTQASEPSTARLVVTVASPAGKEESPMQEDSIPGQQNQAADCAKDKEEEVPTEDPEVGGDDKNCDIVVCDVDESPSRSKSEAGSHVHVNETQDTSPVAEKGSKERPDATRPSELPGPQDRTNCPNHAAPAGRDPTRMLPFVGHPKCNLRDRCHLHRA